MDTKTYEQQAVEIVEKGEKYSLNSLIEFQEMKSIAVRECARRLEAEALLDRATNGSPNERVRAMVEATEFLNRERVG